MDNAWGECKSMARNSDQRESTIGGCDYIHWHGRTCVCHFANIYHFHHRGQSNNGVAEYHGNNRERLWRGDEHRDGWSHYDRNNNHIRAGDDI